MKLNMPDSSLGRLWSGCKPAGISFAYSRQQAKGIALEDKRHSQNANFRLKGERKPH